MQFPCAALSDKHTHTQSEREAEAESSARTSRLRAYHRVAGPSFHSNAGERKPKVGSLLTATFFILFASGFDSCFTSRTASCSRFAAVVVYSIEHERTKAPALSIILNTHPPPLSSPQVLESAPGPSHEPAMGAGSPIAAPRLGVPSILRHAM